MMTPKKCSLEYLHRFPRTSSREMRKPTRILVGFLAQAGCQCVLCAERTSAVHAVTDPFACDHGQGKQDHCRCFSLAHKIKAWRGDLRSPHSLWSNGHGSQRYSACCRRTQQPPILDRGYKRMLAGCRTSTF